MSWYGRLIRLPLRFVPDNHVVRVLFGPLRGARWITGAHTHGCWIGIYETSRQRAFARFVSPGSVVYDCGAQAGFFTLLAARLGAKVVAIEPLPRNLAYLRRHLALNGYEDRVTVIDAALLESGVQTAYLEPVASPASTQVALAGLPVRAISLDTLVSDVPAPTLIKMDIEGAEDRALMGATMILTTIRPVLLLSTHGEAVRERVHALLRQHRYRITPEDPTGRCRHEVIATPEEPA
jgi:FkbM family methyltransferase